MLTSTLNSWSKKISSNKKSFLPTHATAKLNLQSTSEKDLFLKSKKWMDKLMPSQLLILKSKYINPNTKSTALPNMLKTIHSLSITLSMKTKQQTIFIRQHSSLYCQVYLEGALWHALRTVKLVLVRLSQWTDYRSWQLNNFLTSLKKVSAWWFHFSKSMEDDALIYLMRKTF